MRVATSSPSLKKFTKENIMHNLVILLVQIKKLELEPKDKSKLEEVKIDDN